MTGTKLISIRVPADLLQVIDEVAERNRPMTRSNVIVNMLQALNDGADGTTKFIAATWSLCRKGKYTISAKFEPKKINAAALTSKNLITL